MIAKYRVLQAQLKAAGIDRKYHAELLKISLSSYYTKMRADRPWTVEEIYQTMDLLRLPYEQISIVFPPGGMYAGELQGGPPQSTEEILISAIKAYINEVVSSSSGKKEAK